MQQALYIRSSKKSLAKVIVSVGIGLGLLFVGFIFLNRVFERADFYDSFEGFYTEDTEYDVFLCGNSHSFRSVIPMQLWEDYGITAYDLALPGSPIPVTYYMFRNAIKHKKPKIAMLEIYQSEIRGGSSPIGVAHKYFDTVPLSLEKYKDIKDICLEDKNAVNELVFPLSTYHNRWTEITGAMIKNGFGIKNDSDNFWVISKGEEEVTLGKVARLYAPEYQDVLVSSNDYDDRHLADLKTQYIEKFIELCEGNDIIPIVYAVPFDADEDMQRWINAYLKVAEDKGVTTLNLFHENVINPYTDFHDNNHLNRSGATKVTAYLGKYLTGNYLLEDKRNDPDFQGWNTDYDKYREYLAKFIREDNGYTETLVYLKQEPFACELEYTSAHDIENADKAEKMLIEQLGDRITCKKASKIIIEDKNNIDKETGKPKSKEVDIKLTIYDDETGDKIITKYYEESESQSLVKSE